MPSPPPVPPPQHSDETERFIAFAFAGADMVVEANAAGTMIFAAGAFRSRFGREPSSFIGSKLQDIVAALDHEALESALALLIERGRLPPLMLRLSNPDRTPLALAGMALPAPGLAPRLYLSFARPPAPLASVHLAGGMPHALARATEARLRAGSESDLGLLEIVGRGNVVSAGEAIGRAIEAAAPDAIISQIAPGRFGLLGPGGSGQDLLSIAALLETALRTEGVDVSVDARHLSLSASDLTPTQTSRALRLALNVFAREGASGFDKTGLAGGLTAYVRRVHLQAARLRQAIRDTRFALEFQPIVALQDRSVHHYEALIRPRPIPDCAFAGPQDFVMLIEAVGLADELDFAVVRLACQSAEAAGKSVAFNLSGQSVQDPQFRENLVEMLGESPARKAGLIMVEMTETAEIENIDEACLTASALRSLQVPFCLDDFGAGSADIRMLRALTPDIVKLDGSYLAGITKGGREHAFVAGMVDMVRGASAEIVAERVETEAEADALLRLGVHYGQGWLFGRSGLLPQARAARGKASRAGAKETWS